MAYKMKGAPMHDTSSKHGTNANYKKSGAPISLGKILDPLGLKKKLFGGGNKPCPPGGGGGDPAATTNTAVKPLEPNAVSNATTTNAPGMTENIDPTMQSPAEGATMKEGLMKDSPAKGKVWDAIKEGGKKAYDKASQVGMGLKEGLKETFKDTKYGEKKHSIDAYKEGYRREKSHDEGKKTYKDVYGTDRNVSDKSIATSKRDTAAKNK